MFYLKKNNPMEFLCYKISWIFKKIKVRISPFAKCIQLLEEEQGNLNPLSKTPNMVLLLKLLYVLC